MNWINAGGGDWGNPANWQDDMLVNRLPGAADDVVIDVPGTPTITHSQNVIDQIQSLTSNEAISLGAGTIQISTLASTAAFTLAGGTLKNAVVQAGTAITGNSGTLDSVTLNGNMTIPHTRTLSVANGLVLNGTITLDNAGTLSFADPVSHSQSVTTTSAGSIVFNGSGATGVITQNPVNPATAQTVTFGSGITVRGGTGNIGNANSNQNWINNGTINADTSGRTISLVGANWTNNGTWKAANGGTLAIAGTNWANNGSIDQTNSTVNLGGTFTVGNLGTYTRSGGTINLTGTLNNSATTLALDNTTGSWQILTGGKIVGGTVTTTGTAQLAVPASNTGTLDGVRLDGNANVAHGGALSVANGLVLNGTITLDNAGTLSFVDPASHSQSVTTTSAGSIVFNGSGSTGVITQNPVNPATAQTVTFGSGITVRGGTGNIGNANSNQNWINNGTINADTSGRTISLAGANWTNNGTFVAQGGGTLLVQPTTLSNHSAGVLTGGTWKVFTNSILRVINAGVTTNAAAISLDGTQARFQRDAAGSNSLSGLATNAAAGSLTLANTASLATTGAFQNSGTITVGTGSQLSTAGSLTQLAGLSSIDGTLTAVGNVSLGGGALFGSGTIAANLINNALVAPGSALGALQVQGNYTQGAAGTLQLQIAGTVAGSTYDQLLVTGTATLDGTLNVALSGGFNLSLGQSFTALNSASRVGTFTTQNLPPVSGHLLLQTSLTATGVILNVFQENVAILISPTSGLVTTEAGGTATFQVSLTAAPEADVTVTLVSSDTSEGHVPASILFSSGNWNTPQIVTVTGQDDTLVDGDVSYTIQTSVISNDAVYAAIDPDDASLVNRNDDLPQVQAFQVNDGAAQRSRVTKLVVTFNGIVTWDSDAFSVVRTSDNQPVAWSASSTEVDGQTVVTLAFSGAGTEHGSFADGNYLSTVKSGKVRSGTLAALSADRADNFFRYFGDTDGDRDVDNLDYLRFRRTFGLSSSQSGYLGYLDFDGSGTIDTADQTAFLARKGTRLN